MFKVLYHTCLIITKTRSGQKNQEKAKISQQKYHSIIQRYHYRPAALNNRQKFQNQSAIYPN